MFQTIKRNAKKEQKLNRVQSICELPMPRKLRWKVSKRTAEWIDLAKINFDK